MAVDRQRSIAYVYHLYGGEYPREARITAVDSSGNILRSFQVGVPFGSVGYVALIDANRELVVGPDEHEDFLLIDASSGRIINRARAFGCAATVGNDGVLYGVNCAGQLASYDLCLFYRRSFARKSVDQGWPFSD